MDFKFNINCLVKVKLKERGIDVIRERNKRTLHDAENRGVDISFLGGIEPKIDNAGYTTFQLWEFISIFGSFMSCGTNPVFDNDVILLGGEPLRLPKDEVR